MANAISGMLATAMRRLTRRPKVIRRRRVSAPRESCPELLASWIRIREEYFPTRSDLDSFTVRWSRRRQKRVLASCSLRLKVISVAKEMSHAKAQEFIDPLLYHEMCHAALGEEVGFRGSKRSWHGAKFRELEQRHPKTKDLDAWIKGGGWLHVVRSYRAGIAAQQRNRN